MQDINILLDDMQDLSQGEHSLEEVGNKAGIDWSKKNMYEGIGREDLKPEDTGTGDAYWDAQLKGEDRDYDYSLNDLKEMGKLI